MSSLKTLSQCFGRLPAAPELLSHLPLSFRRGIGYLNFKQQAQHFEALSSEQKQIWIYERMRKLVKHAETNIPFYRRLYDHHGFSSKDLGSFSDLASIPIVRKSDLQQTPLEERSKYGPHLKRSNTGGTSGQPLEFLTDPNLFPKESVYMDKIWQRRDYGPGHLKLRFRGANLGCTPYSYNIRESEFLINTYVGYELISDDLEKLLRSHTFKYIHGYPSSIAGFVDYCKQSLPQNLLAKLRTQLKGILLGSEYPAPHYRDLIEEVFGPITISWYGHSEMAVMAGENQTPFVYEPFQGYGFTEAVKAENSESFRLVATNYDGYSCPFIRYDTGDYVTPTDVEGKILSAFRIADGRIGDVVIDRNGHHISLTGLIFGRHHDVFRDLAHLQVAQKNPGQVLLIATPRTNFSMNAAWFWENFDTSGVELSFQVVFLKLPIRTPAGKIPLKVAFPDEENPL